MSAVILVLPFASNINSVPFISKDVAATPAVIVLLVRVSVAVTKETVPVKFGNVIVLSAVGSVIANVVS